MNRARVFRGLAGMAFLSLSFVLFIWWKPDPPGPAESSLDTLTSQPLAMERLLAEIDRAANPQVNEYLSDRRATLVASALAVASDHVQRRYYHQELVKSLLNAGENEKALEALQSYEDYLAREDPNFLDAHRDWLRFKRALCFLRIGEQDNCLHHGADTACLFPIVDSGIHRFTDGSRNALAVFSELLKSDPEYLQASWLAALASMTVGEPPRASFERWGIDPEVLASEYDLGRFHNVARSAGVDVAGLSGGSVAEDFDGDGLFDLMCSGLGLDEPLVYLRNRGDGRFERMGPKAGLTGQVGGLNLVHTDFDNDGFADVFVLRGGWFGEEGRHPNSLLRNRGDGTFEDVTQQAGLLSFHPTQTAVWFDFDADGWLDVFIGNESQSGSTHACELYRNRGDGTFAECADSAGVNVIGFVKAVVSGDFDNDGDSDLYLSVRGAPNRLFRNEPVIGGEEGAFGRRFADITGEAGVAEPLRSFPAWFWDFDNDGWLDLWVSDYGYRSFSDVVADYSDQPHQAERARLYRNQRNGTFAEVSIALGLDRVLYAMGSNYGDLDNDGYLDFYVGTGDPDLATLMPNRMFRNDGGRRFQDVTVSGGFGHLQKGHGVSFADLDNDGDQDIYQDMGGAYSGDVARNALYLNPGHQRHWVGVRLRGLRSNRPSLGARIRVRIREEGEIRTIHRVVSTGGSFGGSPFDQHIGVAMAERIDRLEIEWPVSGTVRSFEDLAADRWYEIEESNAPLRSFDRPKFEFSHP